MFIINVMIYTCGHSHYHTSFLKGIGKWLRTVVRSEKSSSSICLQMLLGLLLHIECNDIQTFFKCDLNVQIIWATVVFINRLQINRLLRVHAHFKFIESIIKKHCITFHQYQILQPAMKIMNSFPEIKGYAITYLHPVACAFMSIWKIADDISSEASLRQHLKHSEKLCPNGGTPQKNTVSSDSWK